MLNSLTGQKNNKTASVYFRCIHGAWRGVSGSSILLESRGTLATTGKAAISAPEWT